MTFFAARHVTLAAVFSALLAGCATRNAAPVVERMPAAKAAPAPAAASAGGNYTVKKGDTLYSIALEHGLSHQDVAAWNNIDNPALIKPGQQLRVTPPEGAALARPVAAAAPVEVRPLGSGAAAVESRPPGSASPQNGLQKHEPKGGKQPYSAQAAAEAKRGNQAAGEQTVALARVEPKPTEPVGANGDLTWAWPGNGKVLAGFSEAGNKGIDIAGRIGDPVLAAEGGKVTYAGNAIRGYGNLLIIQHQNGMSSVYAHNSRLLAKEGQMVAKGQKIAEVGDTDAEQAELHFEIRRQGKPLDPLKYLPQR